MSSIGWTASAVSNIVAVVNVYAQVQSLTSRRLTLLTLVLQSLRVALELPHQEALHLVSKYNHHYKQLKQEMSQMQELIAKKELELEQIRCVIRMGPSNCQHRMY